MIRRAPADLTGKVAVITGASSGIGRGAAVAFARRGARVVLAARSEGSLAEAAEECHSAGGQALAVVTDVADQDAVERLADRAVERFGRIDVWVNNAAVMAYSRFEDLPQAVHRAAIETNLLGQVHGARAVLPRFRAQGRGVLINVGSLYGKMTSPYVSSYVISKYGILGLSEVLRQELHDAPDICVTTILPASIDTPIFRHAANYTGRRPKPVPPVSDPQRVVRAILRSAVRPRREVHVGRVGRLLSLGHAAMPRTYDRLVPRVTRWLALGGADVEDNPGNVFEPMPEWNRITGHWRRDRNRRLRRGAAVAAAALGPLAVARLLR